MFEDQFLYLLALPVLLSLVVIEYVYRRRSKAFKKLDVNIIASNLFLGLIDRLFFLFFLVIQFELMKLLVVYKLIDLNLQLILEYILLVLLVDFIWYWYHRIVHNIPILWMLHSTHHQTNEYSLTLGFRLSFITQILRILIWTPLVFFGFDPIHILIAVFFQNFYQFFIHTEIWSFPKWTRQVLVTPKSHKLHHSNAEAHRNSNYGGVLIIWDKLFKSYRYPYNQDIKIEGDLADSKYIHPLNGLFLPVINFMTKAKEKVNINGINTNGLIKNPSKLIQLFAVFFLPALALIIFSDKLSFIWLVVLSLSLIALIFSALYVVLK